MLSTQILKTILADTRAHELHVLIGRYLCAAGADGINSALDALIEAGDAGAVGYQFDLEMAFGRNVVASTIDTVCEEWSELLDLGVRTTDLETDTGALCMHVLVRAGYMLSGLPDIPKETALEMRRAVAEHCAALARGFH